MIEVKDLNDEELLQLYGSLMEELQLKGVLTEITRDGHRVSLVHHEYPTPFRCDMHDYEFRLVGEEERTPKGGLYQRGHFDFVILNPRFVENNKLNVVCGKDYEIFKSAMQEAKVEPLIWACEVIFFPGVKKLPKNALKIIEQDTLKVKETLKHKVARDVFFCKIGSVLVFTNHAVEEASDLKQQVAKLKERREFEITLLTAHMTQL